MRIVGKIPYKSVDSRVIEKIEQCANWGSSIQIVLDSATEQVLLVIE